MGVPPSVFFMKHDGAGLAVEAELALDFIGSFLEIFDRDRFSARRVQAGREQVVLAARAFGDSIDFAECACQIIAHKATGLM